MGRHGGSGRRGRRGAVAGVLGLVALPLTVGLASTGHAEGVEHVPDTPCTRAAEACVDLEEQEAWLIKDGEVTYGPVWISSGGDEQETPTGRFRVGWKDADHVSGESGAPMPYAVFFAPGGIAFHEGSLDNPSAGCVRLDLDDAKQFFDTLNVGDDVEVH